MLLWWLGSLAWTETPGATTISSPPLIR